jgi:hypothetical protein
LIRSGSTRCEYAPYLSLTCNEARERFSRPAVHFHAVAPVVLGVLLLITSVRCVEVLGPAFRDTFFRGTTAHQLQSQALPPHTAPRTNGDLSPVFTPEVQRWANSIQRWADEYSIPANMIAVVMQIESCGDPLAVSPSGAVGLFQVMPYHFMPGDNPFDVETNAARGLSYLAAGRLQASDDAALTLAGYNGGHAVIRLPYMQWTDETRRYVFWGVGILEDAARGLASSPTLKAWLAAGGHSLCQQAAERVPAPLSLPE